MTCQYFVDHIDPNRGCDEKTTESKDINMSEGIIFHRFVSIF